MDWFFTDERLKKDDTHILTGEDAAHITKSLRMSVGETVTLCDRDKNMHLCLIERITGSQVQVRVSSAEECDHEPDVFLTLYFALTKGDKPETVIQKSVELGASRIVPVLTERCISRPDSKAADKKTARYQKIALQAAMQSRRGIIPEVSGLTSLSAAAEEAAGSDLTILFYEGGGQPLRDIITTDCKSISVFIGPEGGFGENEVELLQSKGAVTATLGKRILRAETAPLAAISAIMLLTHNLE